MNRNLLVATALATAALACSGQVGETDDPGAGGDGMPSPTGGKGGNNPAPAPGMPSTMPTDLSNPGAAACKTPTVGPARIWRLSRDQIQDTIKATLGVTVTAGQLAAFNDASGLLFRTEVDALRIRKTDAASWALSATDVARAALPTLKKTCPDLAAAGCAPTFVDALGLKLFRRPLRAEEKTRYAKLYTDTLAMAPGAAGGDAAAQAVVSAMLQSPYFLYRTELGKPVAGRKGIARLTGHEVASALSYTLWQASPDDELMRAAGAGELDGPDGLRKQAMRMVEDARFQGFYGDMLADLTRASHMASREGADQVSNAATVMAWMNAEFDGFVKAVMAEKPTLDELFTRRRVSAAGDALVYRNLGTMKGSAAVAVDLPAPVGGMLALGAISFANAGVDHPSPVKRGLMVRERLLCAPVPQPPDDVNQTLATGGDAVTNRQKYEKTTSPAQCHGCHRLFNGLGYAFEAFDHVGKYRTMDSGRPLDLSGEVIETRDANFKFANLTELGAGLAKSQQVAECFALQGFRFVSGRLESPGDLCYVKTIYDAFAKSGRNLKTLAVELVTADSFVLRSIEN